MGCGYANEARGGRVPVGRGQSGPVRAEDGQDQGGEGSGNQVGSWIVCR